MGFLRDLVQDIAQSPGNETVTKFDPFADAVTNTLTEATETGWGKPLGSEKSGPDVLGGRFTNELWRGYGGDPDEARDRRLGRTVGSLFAGYGLGSAAGSGIDSIASGATSSGGSEGVASYGGWSSLFGGGGSSGAGLFGSGSGGGMWESLVSSLGPSVISLLGAGMQSKSSKDASKEQADATREGIAENRRQFETIRSDQAPYRGVGQQSVTLLRDLMGPEGYLGRRFGTDDFLNDPVAKLSFQTGLDLGTKALRNRAPLTTGMDSGAALKELTKFGSDYAGLKAGESYGRFVGDQTNTFNRLAALAGIGQTANQTNASAGIATGSNISNLISGQGNANAAARIAQGNAYSGALGNISNWWQQNQMLDRLGYGRGGGGGGMTTYFPYSGYDAAGGPAYG